MTTPPTPPHRTISIIQYKTKSYMNSIPMRQKERQSLVIMCVDPRVIQQHFQSAPGVGPGNLPIVSNSYIVFVGIREQ